MSAADPYAGVERAVAFAALDRLRAWDGPCDRVYFGHEFCQRLLPSAGDVTAAARSAAERGRAFTLVTPFVSNAGLARVRELVPAARAAAGADRKSVV